MQKHLSKKQFQQLKDGVLSYEEFNEFLDNFMNACVESCLQAMPQVIDYLLRQSAHLKELSENFYKNNKDLAEHKELLANKIQEVENDNPGLEYERILDTAATKARESLKLESTFRDSENFSLEKTDSNLGLL